jgi:hypothetical protein
VRAVHCDAEQLGTVQAYSALNLICQFGVNGIESGIAGLSKVHCPHSENSMSYGQRPRSGFRQVNAISPLKIEFGSLIRNQQVGRSIRLSGTRIPSVYAIGLRGSRR